MTSWTVRVVAYVVAAVALIGLLIRTETVTFQPVFIAFLDQLKGVVDLGIPLEMLQRILIDPVMNTIRAFGWHLPELKAHWQQLFVLAWLQAVAMARNNWSSMTMSWSGSLKGIFSTDPNVGRLGEMGLGWRLFVAFAATLPACVIAGLMPLGVSAVFVSLGGVAFALPALFALGERRWRHAAILLACFAAWCAVQLTTANEDKLAVVLMASLIAAATGVGLLLSLVSSGTWQQRLSHPRTLTFADVLAAYGIAFAAVVFLSDPPWVRLWF
jgi:hypothetical protein